jgi:hypothetical protein
MPAERRRLPSADACRAPTVEFLGVTPIKSTVDLGACHRPTPTVELLGSLPSKSTLGAGAGGFALPRLAPVEYALALLLLAVLVAVVVLRPLCHGATQERHDETRIADLSAAKEAKYREIRDAELDHRMGKLSREDWRAVDRELRGEAIEILHELDRLEGRSPEERTT